MSAPIPVWINFSRALSVIRRELQTTHDRHFEAELLEAFASGEIRVRRLTTTSFDAPSEKTQVTELKPHSFRSRTDLEGMHGYSDDQQPDQYVTFEVHYTNLREWLSPTKEKVERRGRPADHDWAAFWVEATLLANTIDGLPDTQAEFVRHMSQWFENTFGKVPSDSQIKERASKLYNAKREKAEK